MPQARQAIALVLAALVAGCGKGAGDSDAGLSGSLGPEGGTLQVGGVLLSVPEGALNERVEISVTVLEAGGTEVPGRVRVSKVFQMKPETVRFLTPATVTVAYDPALLPPLIAAREADVRHTDYSRPTPERLGSTLVDEGAQTVSGETLGLGTFWATAPEGARPVTVTVTPDSRTVYVGDKVQFEVEVRDQKGLPMSTQDVTWETSNRLVASVGPTGEAEAVAPGTCELIARVGAVQGRASLLVASADPFAQTFTWESPLPGADDLWGVRADPLGVAVAGSHGTVAVYAQGAWSRLSSAPLVRLRDLGVQGEEVVAIGARAPYGVLIRSDGKAASTLYVPDTDLLSLWLDGDQGMAVGEGPNLARRDALGQWVVEGSPVTEPLLAVDGVDGEPVVVGARGAVYRRAGEAWVPLAQAPLPEFLVRAVARGEEAWGISAKRLWHFEAGAWTALALPVEPVLTLSVIGRAGEALVVSGVDDKGKTYVLVQEAAGPGFTVTAPGGPLHAVSGLSPTKIWAVGPAGAILAFDGTDWTSLRQGPATDLVGLAVFDGPQVFAATNACVDEACAEKRGVVLARGADGLLAPVPATFETVLRGIGGRSADDLWAVGEGGKAYHLQSGAWTTVSVPQAMSCVVECHDGLHACGTSAVLAESGGAWTERYQGVGTPKALSCSAAGLWVVGDYSIYRVVGGRAEALNPLDDLLLPAPWRAVWSGIDGQAIVGGEARYLLHWNGEKFLPMDQPGNVPIVSTRAIWGTGIGNVWAGGVMRGGASFLIHYNGAFWQPVDPGADAALGAMGGLATGDLWIGGAGGALLHGALPIR